MATKRTPIRRERRAGHELKAWRIAFTTGHDYFGQLAEFGIEGCCQNREALHSAARDAWERLGTQFMESWQSSPARSRPWALEQFGEPHAD